MDATIHNETFLFRSPEKLFRNPLHNFSSVSGTPTRCSVSYRFRGPPSLITLHPLPTSNYASASPFWKSTGSYCFPTKLNRKINISLSPFAPENLISRDGLGSPVPRQPAHLHTQAKPGSYLRESSRFPRRRPFIYLNRHTPSGQARIYRVTQLRTDGVHCRKSAGTGPPVNIGVVPVTGAAFVSPWTNYNALSFPQTSIAEVRWKNPV